MGNSIGIKLISISNNQILNSIIFPETNNKIIPYIYFISKINDIFIQNFNKSNIINKITLFNIITLKETNINLNKTTTENILKDVNYLVCKYPNINNFLLISNVIKNSFSEKKKIKKNKMILIGTDKKYFNNINDIMESINDKKSKFIFYNFEEDYLLEINNEENKDENLGFEIQEMKRESFIKFYIEYNQEKRKEKKIKEERLKIEKLIEEKNKKIKEDEKNNITNENQINDNQNNNNNENIIENNKNNINNINIIKENENNIENINNLKIKEKYKKNLKIYNKIDTNFLYLDYISPPSNTKDLPLSNILYINSFDLRQNLSNPYSLYSSLINV